MVANQVEEKFEVVCKSSHAPLSSAKCDSLQVHLRSFLGLIRDDGVNIVEKGGPRIPGIDDGDPDFRAVGKYSRPRPRRTEYAFRNSLPQRQQPSMTIARSTSIGHGSSTTQDEEAALLDLTVLPERDHDAIRRMNTRYARGRR